MEVSVGFWIGVGVSFRDGVGIGFRVVGRGWGRGQVSRWESDLGFRIEIGFQDRE